MNETFLGCHFSPSHSPSQNTHAHSLDHTPRACVCPGSGFPLNLCRAIFKHLFNPHAVGVWGRGTGSCSHQPVPGPLFAFSVLIKAEQVLKPWSMPSSPSIHPSIPRTHNHDPGLARRRLICVASPVFCFASSVPVPPHWPNGSDASPRLSAALRFCCGLALSSQLVKPIQHNKWHTTSL